MTTVQQHTWTEHIIDKDEGIETYSFPSALIADQLHQVNRVDDGPWGVAIVQIERDLTISETKILQIEIDALIAFAERLSERACIFTWCESAHRQGDTGFHSRRVHVDYGAVEPIAALISISEPSTEPTIYFEIDEWDIPISNVDEEVAMLHRLADSLGDTLRAFAAEAGL